MNREQLQKRTNEFAHRCVKLSLALTENDLARHIRKQLIRCCTSVASNYRAACVAQSKASFYSKLSIVVEEVDECCFWMQFVVDEKLLEEKKVSGLLDEAKQLTAIFIASRKTLNEKK